MFKATQDHIFVQLPESHRTFVENVLNGTFSKKEKAFRFPKNIHAMRELAKSFPQLQQNDDFMKVGQGLKSALARLISLKQLDNINGFTEGYLNRLRPYQKVDVTYLKQIPSAGIFNEPRTGKTPTTITLLKELGTKRNLIVCPASLIWNWANEFKKWYPECTATVINGNQKKRTVLYDKYSSDKEDGEAVLIISKDTLKSKFDSNLLSVLLFHTVIIDEAHFLRNYKSKQSEAIYKIKAERRYALTGTPTVKHPVDIFGILHFLYPKKFPSYWQFAERYFEVAPDWMGHMQVNKPKPHREQELQELIGFMSVQRKRKEVMPWLPDKTYQDLSVRMEGKQLKLYNQMVADFMATDDDGTEVDTSSVLTQFMRLRQLCLDPALLGFDAPSAKTEALLDYLDNKREPMVIMSMFTSYLKLLKPKIEKLGLKVGFIHGEMSNKAKEEAKESFQTEQTDVLLCNTISAGVGFTLDRGQVVLFTDLPWDYAALSQAEDRIMPTTKERNHSVDIIFLSCLESADERINDIVKSKKSLTDIVNEGGRNAIERLLKG